MALYLIFKVIIYHKLEFFVKSPDRGNKTQVMVVNTWFPLNSKSNILCVFPVRFQFSPSIFGNKITPFWNFKYKTIKTFFCFYFLDFDLIPLNFLIPCVFPKFSNSVCFPCLELLFTIFPVLRVKWELCNTTSHNMKHIYKMLRP